MYIECPHCHAIFSLPDGIGEIPERVRCGECNTIFIPEPETQDNEQKEEVTVTPASKPLSIDDFLTNDEQIEVANQNNNLIEIDNLNDKDNIQTEESTSFRELQNYLSGDDYPVEPEAEAEPEPDLPDLNAMSSSDADPLKQEQEDEQSYNDDSDLETTADDETADLVSDRFEDNDEDEPEAAPINEDLSNKEPSVSTSAGLPEIQDELITIQEDKQADDQQEKDGAADAVNDKFRVYFESVQQVDDYPDEQDPSITSEISAFIDEIDEDPDNLFSGEGTESEIDASLLDLEDEDSNDDTDEATGMSGLDEEPKPEQAELLNETEQLELADADTDSNTAESHSHLITETPKPATDEEPPLNLGISDENFIIEEAIGGSKKLFYPYVIGGFLLILLLGLQYMYTNREQFAAYPETRGIVTTLCKITGCELAPQVNLASIQLLNHAVYSHPTRENALIIKALIRNRAEFQQPYPIIKLTLGDLNDNMVAMRRFGPGEYLSEQVEENALMPVNQNIAVQLQVIDPGPNAVAFEFDFL